MISCHLYIYEQGSVVNNFHTCFPSDLYPTYGELRHHYQNHHHRMIPIIIIAFLVLESPHPAAVRRSHQPFRIWFQLLSISAGLPNLLTYLIEPPGFTHLTNLTDLPYPLNQTQTKQTRQLTQFKLFWHRVVSQCYVCVWGWILLAPVFLFSSGLPSHPPRSPPPVCCFQKQVLECTSPWLGMRKMYQIMDVIKKLLFPTFL